MASWIWQAMSGNGVRIGTAATIAEALGKILKGLILVVNACCEADRGVRLTMPTCVVPIAIGFPPISGLTTRVFDALAM